MYFLSLQIYFLTVLFNSLAGLILASEYIKDKIPVLEGLVNLLNGKEVKFIIGIGSLITGVFKFITPIGILIIGDLLPGIVSLGLGIVLLMDFFKESTSISSETIEKIDSLLLSYKNVIGGLGLGSAAVHFIFAGVPAFL